MNLWDQKRSVALYRQLEQIIESKIFIGEWSSGERIPTEKELCETYHVSLVTSRQAILNLVQKGLLIRQQGKGTFVTSMIKNRESLPLVGTLDDLINDGLKVQEVKVIDMTRVKAPDRIAESLKIEKGSEVTKVRRVRISNRSPISYIVNYLRPGIGERIDVDDLTNFPMLHVLRKILKISIGSGMQYIQAIVADYEISSVLSVSLSSPITFSEAIMFEEDGTPVELAQMFVRPDRFKYAVKLQLKD